MRTDLPPEAFTKETLQEAFQWLQNQPDAIRATVNTPERLVSLYRKAQRLEENSDTPVSSKKFIDDLKNLATSLNEFGSVSAKKYTQQTPKLSPPPKPIEETKIETKVEPKSEPKKLISQPTQPKTPATSEAKSTLNLKLDPISAERVASVQKRFNLSSEDEALRVLIALGFEKFSQLN